MTPEEREGEAQLLRELAQLRWAAIALCALIVVLLTYGALRAFGVIGPIGHLG